MAGIVRAPRRLACWLLAAAASLSVPAAAQVSEADRLARCANNRAQIARIEAEAARMQERIDSYWSDEKMARARAFRTSVGGSSAVQRPLSDRPEIVRGWNQTAREFGIAPCTKPDSFVAYHSCGGDYWGAIDRLITQQEALLPEKQAVIRQRQALLNQAAPFRTNLVALDCDRPGETAATATAASAADRSAWMTGIFTTTYGEMTLSPSGGSYTQDNGRITVRRISGDVMEGLWEEASSGRQCADGRYYGRIRFTFTAQGFSGAWGYCDDEPSRAGWTGTRK